MGELADEELKILMDLGLTLLQAKIFLVLVENECLRVNEISKLSNISRPDVYRNLLNLQKLGLVEKIILKPYEFKTIPIVDAFELLMNRRINKTKDLKIKTQILIKKPKVNNKKNITKEFSFVLFPSQKPLLVQLSKAIKRTKESIDILTTSNRLKNACFFLSEPILDAWKRNVKGRAIIENGLENNFDTILDIWRNPFAGIRYLSHIPDSIFAIYDRKEVFIFTQPNADIKESPALWSNNMGLVNLAINYFEVIWNNPSLFGKINSTFTKNSIIKV